MTQDSHISSPSAVTQAARRRGLGRGLDALFENAPKAAPASGPEGTEGAVRAPLTGAHVQAAAQNAAPQQNRDAGSAETNVQANVRAAVQTGSGGASGSTKAEADADFGAAPFVLGRTMLAVASLQPGAFQPRRTFDALSIESMAQSILQHGILQPLLVRPLKDNPGRYEIIAGERRWRAAQRARLHDVPVVIEPHLSDRDALQIGLVENLQREDLNPIDEAAGYQRLVDEFHLTPDRLGDMIGKSRGHIANMMRLLNLPEGVRAMVVGGNLSAGHARALIGLPDAEGIAREVADKGLSVRQVEKMAAEMRDEGRAPQTARGRGRKATKSSLVKPHDVEILERSLCSATGLNVTIDMKTETGGRMSIDFKNLDQLDLVVRRLLRGKGDPE